MEPVTFLFLLGASLLLAAAISDDDGTGSLQCDDHAYTEEIYAALRMRGMGGGAHTRNLSLSLTTNTIL